MTPVETIDSADLGAQFSRANAVVALSNRTLSPSVASLRAQVELLEHMRVSGATLVEPEEATKAIHLVWRLMLATSLAVATLTAGLVLTVAASLGGSLNPSPLIALSVLLGGAVLTLTVVAAVRES